MVREKGGGFHLPPHYDESTHSFIIALNNEFKGGGTFIHSLGKTLAPAVAGGMVSFCGGEVLHSGDPVVEGVRYIIAAFCYVDVMNSDDAGDNSRYDTASKGLKQSRLQGVFINNQPKSNSGSASVEEKSQMFSFGFNI